MVGGEHNLPSEARAIFELERFSWGAPDELQLLGRFVGLGEAPMEAPALVIRGAKRTHRLAVAAGDASGPPRDRRRWRAAFRWEEVPEPFEVAELELGDLVVELPAPRSGRRAFDRQPLPVRQASGGRGEQVRLQVELAAAREEISELRSALEQSGKALTRARDDLEAERTHHALDAEQFHQGLATLRASAEDALAAEQEAAERLASELREARGLIAAREAELGSLSDEVQTLRRELDIARDQVLAVAAKSEAARSSAEDGRAEAERLLSHLTNLQQSLDE